jgi:hypothetical protein
MADLRWAAPAWTFWLVLALPLVGAQPEAACPSPGESGGGAASVSECPATPRPALSPLDVLLSGGGILGSLLLLRKGPTAPS